MVDSELSITQFSILRALDRHGDMTLTELAEELVMERTSLYRTIAPLECRGAVAIESKKTGRAKIAKLSKKGVKMMMAASPHWERAQSAIIEAIGKGQWQALSKSLMDLPSLVDAQK